MNKGMTDSATAQFIVPQVAVIKTDEILLKLTLLTIGSEYRLFAKRHD